MQLSNIGKLWKSVQSYWSAREVYYSLVERRFALCEELSREINRILFAKDRLSEAEHATYRELLRRNSVTEFYYQQIEFPHHKLEAIKELERVIALQLVLLHDIKQFTWH